MTKLNVVNEAKLTVLCVDDEVNILKSMKRLLYKQNYQLLLADSGAKALELMKQHDVHLILSDMKMPIMSGAEFLEKVAISSPDTYRVLLTGYSDIESTIDAVNKGKIHRYLQKPWDNEEVIQIVEEGLDRIRLKNENAQLQALVKEQNKQLKEMNHSLEEKVNLRTKQIQTAIKKIERNNNATQKVLYNLISINPNLNGDFANSVSLLARQIAEKLSLPKQQVSNISFAALIGEIGLLGLDTAVYSKPYRELNSIQQQEYFDQIKIAKLVLAPATHLTEVSDIISYQFEYLNGSGPNKLFDEQIPIGAKILSVARDYWRYSMGRITSVRMDNKAVFEEMQKFLGTLYDETVLNVLLENDDIISQKFLENTIATQELKPGMILKYSLFNRTHILLLPEGHVFSEETISKLIQFEKKQAEPLTLIIEEYNEET